MEAVYGPYSGMFLEHTPDQLLRNGFRCLIDAYSQSHSRAKQEFPTQVANNFRPFLRRAIIESQLVNLSGSHQGVTASFENDICSRFWTHAVINCNDRVAITQSTGRDPDYVVRHSDLRDQYAARNGQMSLFDDVDSEQASDDAQRLYAILLHGRDLESPGKLGFAVIRFPLPKLAGYYSDRIDLFLRYPDLAKIVSATHTDPSDRAIAEEDVGDLPPIDLNEQDNIG